MDAYATSGGGQTAQSRNLTLHSRLSPSPVRFGLLFFLYFGPVVAEAPLEGRGFRAIVVAIRWDPAYSAIAICFVRIWFTQVFA